MTDARSAKRIRFIVILALVLVAGIVTWRVARPKPGNIRQLNDATITRIDAGAGAAEIEFVHPKTGQTMRLSATVGPNCSITLDGKPATIRDLRVGDKIDVRGVVKKDFFGASVEPQQVTVRRGNTATPAAATASQPAATAPARSPATAPAADQP